MALAFQGLWIHGNLLKALPEGLGGLTALRTLSAVGNHLEGLPDSLGNLRELRDLELAGNRLQQLPATIGNLGAPHPYLNLLRESAMIAPLDTHLSFPE